MSIHLLVYIPFSPVAARMLAMGSLLTASSYSSGVTIRVMCFAYYAPARQPTHARTHARTHAHTHTQFMRTRTHTHKHMFAHAQVQMHIHAHTQLRRGSIESSY